MRLLRPSVVAAALAMSATTAMIPTQPASAYVAIGISVNFAPPPLPFYVQPPCPGPGFIWTPGYWAWDDYEEDYYWVPGTWVLAPYPGFLWTPAWWGWDRGVYLFHAGYWGRDVGYYGGIVYGFGYDGFGYDGGYWSGDRFFYNRSVNNITNVNITNVYYRTVIENRSASASFNGPGGATGRPTPAQLMATREQRFAPTSEQTRMVRDAAGMQELHAKFNRGAPLVAASPHPGEFRGPGVVAAAGARSVLHAPADNGEARGRGAPFQPGGAPNRADAFARERRGGPPPNELAPQGGPGRFAQEPRRGAGPAPGPGAPEPDRRAFTQERRGREGPPPGAEGPGPGERAFMEGRGGRAGPPPDEIRGPDRRALMEEGRGRGGPPPGAQGPGAGERAFMEGRGGRAGPPPDESRGPDRRALMEEGRGRGGPPPGAQGPGPAFGPGGAAPGPRIQPHESGGQPAPQDRRNDKNHGPNE